MDTLKSMAIIISNILIIFMTLFFVPNFNISQSQLSGNLQSPQSNSVNLIIYNLTVGYSPTGLVSIKGTVSNNASEDVENLKVDAILYDSNNKTIIKTSRYISTAYYTFEPNSTENFDFLMSTGDFNHYVVRAYADKIP